MSQSSWKLSKCGFYRAFACDVTRTSRGVQLGPHCAYIWHPGLPPYEAVFKNEAHRCRVGRKGRQMVPRTAFKSTFDQRKRNKKTWPKETVEQRAVRK